MEHRFVVAGLFGCLLAVVGSAQDRPAFRSNTDLVTLSCTVLDERGATVRGLGAGDFRVFDNGRRRLIDHVWLDSDSPLTLGVIVDASASQQSKVDEHRRTASKVLEQILRPGDRAFVISLAHDVRLWTDSTASIDEIRSRLTEGPGALFGAPCVNSPRSNCGTTRLWDAIFDAARLKLRSIQGNKALLLLTDGFDSGSVHNWRDASDEVHKAGASVYAIQYRSDLGGTFPQNLYKLLSDAGGTWFSEPNGKYDSIALRIQTDLREHYVLSFRPDKLSPAARHEVEVQLTRPELTVRGRKIYFWTPE